jgi:hypothetical protein
VRVSGFVPKGFKSPFSLFPVGVCLYIALVCPVVPPGGINTLEDRPGNPIPLCGSN